MFQDSLVRVVCKRGIRKVPCEVTGAEAWSTPRGLGGKQTWTGWADLAESRAGARLGKPDELEKGLPDQARACMLCRGSWALPPG